VVVVVVVVFFVDRMIKNIMVIASLDTCFTSWLVVISIILASASCTQVFWLTESRLQVLLFGCTLRERRLEYNRCASCSQSLNKAAFCIEDVFRTDLERSTRKVIRCIEFGGVACQNTDRFLSIEPTAS